MPLKRPTTTPVPDEIIDRWLPELSEVELKVLLYIVRRTSGFDKRVDAISYTQFLKGITCADGQVLDRGCVRSRTSLSRALQSLEDRQLIRTQRSKTRSGDSDVTLYSLWFEEDIRAGEVVQNEYHGSPDSVPGVVPPVDHGGTQSGLTRNSDPRNSNTRNSSTGTGGADAQPRASTKNKNTAEWVATEWLDTWLREFVARIGWKAPLPATMRKLGQIVLPFLECEADQQRATALAYLFSNDYLHTVGGGIFTAVKSDLELWIAKGMPSSKNGSARGGGKKLTGSAAHRMDWDMSLAEQKAMLAEEQRGANLCPDCGINGGRHIAWCGVKPPGAEIVPDPFADPTDTRDPLYQPRRKGY